MNIRQMRFIDYWAGVPSCFFLTILNFVFKIVNFNRRGRKAGLERILFIKLSELGAIVLAYPFLNKVKKEYPSTDLFFLTFHKNRGIFKLLDQMVPDKNIFAIREGPVFLFAMDTLNAIRRIRKAKIDIVFDLELFSRFTAILAYLSKAKKRAGYYQYTLEGLYRGNLLTHKFQYNPLLHISRSYLSLLQTVEKENKNTPELEEKIKDTDVSLPYAAVDLKIKERIRQRLNEFGVMDRSIIILINPGEGALPLREWPLDNFIVLAKKILEDKNSWIIITGTKDASKKSELMCSAIQDKRCVDFTGATTIEELLGLFNIADALVTNDCGLAHLAALTPIQKFIFFGPESPDIFGPLGNNNVIIYSNFPCSPCLSALNHRDSACADNNCLKVINPDKVYKLMESVLFK